MDQSDIKIDLICGSVTYISWSIDFALHLVIDLNYFIFSEMAPVGGIRVPPGTCSS